jgi:hypothetical protein
VEFQSRLNYVRRRCQAKPATIQARPLPKSFNKKPKKIGKVKVRESMAGWQPKTEKLGSLMRRDERGKSQTCHFAHDVG